MAEDRSQEAKVFLNTSTEVILIAGETCETIDGFSAPGSAAADPNVTPPALTEREQELSEAHRIARLGTWRWIRASDTVSWSNELYRIFCHDPQLPLPGFGGHLRSYTPESKARLEEAVQISLQRGEPYQLDLEIVVPEGRTRWITVRGEVGSYMDGIPATLRGTVQDITERKQNEERLALSAARYRSLVRATSEIVWVADADGLQRGEVADWLSFTGQTAKGWNWLDAIHPDDGEETMARWKEAVAAGSMFQVEHRVRRHDGVYRNMQARAVPVHDASGKIVEWIGTNSDITERKRAEEALREREQRFRVLAESLPQLIWITSSAGENSYCNRRFEEYTGIPVDAFMGTSWKGLIHPADLESTLEKWKRSGEAGEVFEHEYRLRRYDGTYRHFLARAVPVHSVEGQIEQWLGSSTDIHEQKLAEEAMRRTEKLAAAGRLAASMAHEINNPLAAVVNTLFLALKDEQLSEGTRNLLNSADRELARVGQYVTRTLRFHKQSTAPADTDLGDLMDSVLEMYGPRFRSSSIVLEKQYRTDEKLYCFSSDLRQVFANLVGNALDAAGKNGRVRVRIRSCRDWHRPGTRGMRVLVADTGAGIPHEVRAQLFEPFVSTKEDTGLGLGLWVSRGIVHHHHGRVSFRSSRQSTHHGTVFCVFLPLVPHAQ